MYLHNMALELLNHSFIFMVGMLVYSFTPFMVDPSWRLYVGYFLVVQMIIIVAANLMLMWQSIIWQIFWKMDQEEKVYEAIIHRSRTMIERQKKKEIEQDAATQLHVINEMSSDSDLEEPVDHSRHEPHLNDLEQLVALGPDIDDKFSSERSALEISEDQSESQLEAGENQQEAFDHYLKQWGAKLNHQMEENEMKQSAYTEQQPRVDAVPEVPMNATDGMAANEKVAVNSPFNAPRPESSSSNESDQLVLTSKVNRRKTNLGKKQRSVLPPTQSKDSLAPGVGRAQTLA